MTKAILNDCSTYSIKTQVLIMSASFSSYGVTLRSEKTGGRRLADLFSTPALIFASILFLLAVPVSAQETYETHLDRQAAPATVAAADRAPARRLSLAASDAVFYGGAGADLATTLVALQNPHLSEGNPLLNIGGRPALIATKAGGTAVIAYAMRHVAKRGHPKAAKVMGYAFGAFWAGLAVHNARLIQRHSR